MVNGVDYGALVRYLARHPSDVPVVARAGWRLRANGWWRRRPFLPLPDPSYWRFRLVTATGSPDGSLDVHDVIAAARWSMRQRGER